MVIKMYLPDDLQIQVHQSIIQMYPDSFSPGFYWYGKRKHGPGHASIKKLRQIFAALGQPLISNDNYQAEAATKTIIGSN